MSRRKRSDRRVRRDHRGRREDAKPPALRSSAAARAAEYRERRNWSVAVASLIGIAAILGMTAGILFSDLFAVQEVRVICADDSLQGEAAERAAELQFNTIWIPPTRAIEEHIGGLPRACETRIDRHLPSTLLILIEPRQPFAFVTEENRYMAVDPEGVCLHWTGAPPEEMPTIRIEAPSSMEVGRRLSERDVALFTAVMDGLAETQLQAGASIDISHPARITIFTAGGVLGKLGNQELLYEKTLLFGKLLHALLEDGETPLYIDLRVPSRPTYRPMN